MNRTPVDMEALVNGLAALEDKVATRWWYIGESTARRWSPNLKAGDRVELPDGSILEVIPDA